MSTEPDFKKLLEKGFFPKELPPCFSTIEFSKAISSRKELLEKLDEQVKQQKHSYFASFSVPKWSGFRRQLSIPNPLFYTALSKEVCNHWALISRLHSKSTLSKSSVRIASYNEERYLQPKMSGSHLVNLKALHGATAKFVLYADVTNYYSSIYTHVLSWCLHGKRTARRNLNNRDLAGNILDRSVRSLQHDESFGIPIGPDTSLALSEIVGATIDRILVRQLKKLNIEFGGFQYFDDYTLYFSKESDARIALECIRSALIDLRLSLNEQKTYIKQLPEAIEKPWKFEIMKFDFVSRYQISDIKHFFSIAFDAQEKYPHDPVLPYALRVLYPDKNKKAQYGKEPLIVKRDYWEQFLSFVCQAVTTKPEGLRFGFALLDYYKRNREGNKPYDWKILEQSINYLIAHSSSNDDYELAWSLWFVRHFNLDLQEEAAKVISNSKNSVVILLALDLQNSGIVPEGVFDETYWKNLIDRTNTLNSPLWLLYYECAVKKWLGLNRNSLRSHYWMKKLSEARVEFFRASTFTRNQSQKVNSDDYSLETDDFIEDWHNQTIGEPTIY